MKTLNQLLLLSLTTVLIYTGCEKTKSLLDVTFDADFDTNLNVVVEPAGDEKALNGVFYASAEIDPMSNNDFAEYAEKIKNIKVKSVVAEVTSISMPAVLLSADLTISSDGVDPASWAFANEDLHQGKTFTLGNENGQWDRVQAMLNNQNLINVVIEGSTDEDNLEFTLKVTIRTEVVANPL
jgi:hypothetical protein